MSWLWFERFNEMPWGERKHGWPGLIESYQELLEIHDIQHTILFMGKYVMKQIHQKEECPCGSSLPFKKCHRKIITKLENGLPKDQLFSDFLIILGVLT